MAITLTNFLPVGFDSAPDVVHIDGDGLLSAHPASSSHVIDAGGAYLSPGWCDLHVHVWYGGTDSSVRASEAGCASGVTAMADAGSAGEANFHGLREYVIDPAAETIRAFLNIGSIGLVAGNRVSELIDMRSIDVERTLAVIEANRDVICGIKVRASGVIVGAWGITPLRIAKRVAEIAKLPLMVHVGEPPPLIDEVLSLLDSGDIVTHCFNGKAAGSFGETEALWRTALEAAERGIRMDVGHGKASFDFDVARRAITEGFSPFSISTDLHRRNIDGPVYDLALTLSKMLALGMEFEDGIAAVTERPRSVLGLKSRAAMQVGMRADFTLFNLVDADVVVTDSRGKTLHLSRRVAPVATLIGASYRQAYGRMPPTSAERP